MAPHHIAAVVMITFNRPTYLRKAVDSLLSIHHRDPGYRWSSRHNRLSSQWSGLVQRCLVRVLSSRSSTFCRRSQRKPMSAVMVARIIFVTLFQDAVTWIAQVQADEPCVSEMLPTLPAA